MMIKNKIFDQSGISFYQQILKVSSAAGKTTAANIANVGTQGYDAKSVDFKEEMKNFLSTQKHIAPIATEPGHIAPPKPNEIVHIQEIGGDENASGINNVDIEKEMTNLSESQIIYELGAKKAAKAFGLLRMAIRGKSV